MLTSSLLRFFEKSDFFKNQTNIRRPVYDALNRARSRARALRSPFFGILKGQFSNELVPLGQQPLVAFRLLSTWPLHIEAIESRKGKNR